MAGAQGAIDRCVRGVDGLAPGATAFGTKVADSTRAQSVAQDCETAKQQAGQSPMLRLATARALVWAGREDAALVRLEQIIGSNQGAADLAASLCARGTV